MLVKVLLALSLGVSAHARTLTSDEKLGDFRELTTIIKAGYGPYEYKISQKIIDPAALDTRYESEILQTQSNRDFYYAMVRYVAEYKDGHFHLGVPSNHQMSVPIVTDLVDGKVLITKIDRTKLDSKAFPFEVGDEITAVDGLAIAKFLDENSRYVGSGTELSRRRFASWAVFSRKASYQPLSNAKTVKVEIRRGTSSVIDKAELTWTVAGKALDEGELTVNHTPLMRNHAQPRTDYSMMLNESHLEYLHPSADSDFMCSGQSRIERPEGSVEILKSPGVAYYFPTPKGNIGYLRIPHYAPGMNTKPGETPITHEAWMAQYRYAIRELERNTVGLIIDQDHNCGGRVDVVHENIALFMDRPFAPAQFQLLASKESYLDMSSWRDLTPEHTIEREGVERVLKVIEDTWKAGKEFLTPKVGFDGATEIQPDLYHYTKPVVILIDEISGSGGDMFPAMMKGLGRAKLFGQNTSGLGGHVIRYPAQLPNSQLRFSLTKSLFFRPDGVAVENNGAVPDRRYAITRDDILYGFRNYRQAFTDYLLEQIP